MMDHKKIFLLISIFLLGACQAVASPTGEVTSLVRTPTWTPSSTRTPSPTPTYTSVPLSKLLSDENYALIEELLTTNGGCRLPCWWGFTPGETKWEDAREFLEEIVLTLEPGEREGYSFYGVTFPVNEEFISVNKIFPDPSILHNAYYVKDEIIEIIGIEVGLMSTYDLPNLLKEYGQPDEIYILISEEVVFIDWIDFAIFISYSQQGIGAFYIVKGEKIGDEIQGCYVDENAELMILWPPNKDWTILQVFEKVELYYIDFPFRLLEEVADMDEESFYQKYKGTTEPICITVPKESFYNYDQWLTPTP